MANRTIRPATEQDLHQLTALKTNYIRSLYRGFLSDKLMDAADEAHYLPEFQICLDNPAMHMDVMELDGHVAGFAIYGADPSEPGCGLIHETVADLACESSERDAIVAYIVEQLARMGYRKIHIWLLRDNFRVRFLMEQFGFKPDGLRRTVEREDQELVITRYLYRAPGYDAGI